MYEYELYNKKNNETRFAWGYNVADMKCRCKNIDWNEWAIIRCGYID